MTRVAAVAAVATTSGGGEGGDGSGSGGGDKCGGKAEVARVASSGDGGGDSGRGNDYLNVMLDIACRAPELRDHMMTTGDIALLLHLFRWVK